MPTLNATACRRFGIADGLVLVAAIATGLAPVRSSLSEFWGEPWWIRYPVAGIAPVLASLTLAIIVLRLRRPRPPIRLVLRQPGLLSGLVVLPILIAWTIAFLNADINEF